MDRRSVATTLVSVSLLAVTGMLAFSPPPAAQAQERRATSADRRAVTSAAAPTLQVLEPAKPEALPAASALDAYRDPRIERNAIPEEAGDGLTDADILILWRGAKFLLDQGRCARVDYANRSFVDASRYFVQDGLHGVYFTEADLPR